MAKLSSKLKKALGLAGKKFKKVDAASAGGFSNDSVDDGRYSAKLTGGELKELGDKAAVVLTYTISGDADGGDVDCDGEEVVAKYFLETDQNISFLKRDLGKFVEEVDELDLAEDLESTLESIVEADADCIISVRMAGEFQNVYLNKVDVDGADAEEEDDDEDEKPKGKKGKKTASGGKGGKKGGKKADADEEEEEDDEEEAAEIEEGDVVEFKPPRAKKAVRCIVVKVKGEKATLQVEDDEDTTYKGIVLDQLELVDPEEDDDEEEDDEDEKPKGKKGKKGGKKGKKKDEEEDDDAEEDDEESEVEIEKGSEVVVTYKAKEYTGKVKDMDEDDETVTVKFKVGKELITKTFPVDKVEAA